MQSQSKSHSSAVSLLVAMLFFALCASSVFAVPMPGKATNPNPADQATGVSITADLSWTAGSNAESHDVYFGTTSPGTSRGNQEETTYDPGTMSDSTTYYWRIDEVNSKGTTTGDVWYFVTEAVDTTAPSVPSRLAAAKGDGQVILDWNDNTEADLDGYNVYRSTTTGSGYSKLNGSLLSNSDYTDTSVTNDTTYYYVATAEDTSSNESEYSNEFSVVPGTTKTYYVATTGDDEDPGTLGEPFATIQHAADLMGASDTCYIRGGTYHETVTFTTDTLLGSSGNPVTFTNYQNETVILDGAEAISGTWTQHSGNIYKTGLSDDIWQLFVDGEMMINARWPNATMGSGGNWWDQDATWGHQGDSSTYGHMYDDGTQDLAGSGLDVTGAMAILNLGRFRTHDRFVNSHTSGNSDFTYDADFWATLEDSDFWTGALSRGRYYLECKLNLLDVAKEWFYDDSANVLYLWAPEGGSPTGTIKGRTQTHAFDITGCRYITISGLDFFATGFSFVGCDHITLEDGDLKYYSYNKRMVGEECPPTTDGQKTDAGLSDAKMWGITTDSVNTIKNCTFAFTDGAGLDIKGDDDTLENCLFHDIDWSGYGETTVMAKRMHYATVRRNTIYTAGASECLCVGNHALTELNDVYEIGYLQQDGAGMDIDVGKQNGTICRYNWTFDHPKAGIRCDGTYPTQYDTNATVHHNIMWNVVMMHIKGDYHKVYNNLAYDCNETDIVVQKSSDPDENSNSITRNNAAGTLSGYRKDVDYALPGTYSNNWTGHIPDQVRNWSLRDFRPKAGSDLINAGYVISGVTDGYLGSAPDIGPYEYGCTNYWLPGYQAAKAGKPIPADGTDDATTDTDVIWLGGKDGVSYNVYFGTTSPGTSQGNQSNNIYDPGSLSVETTYYWRIDTVTASTTVTGDVWSLYTGYPTLEFFPTDDASCKEYYPTTNYGDDSTLTIMGEPSGSEKESYLKFVITGTNDVQGVINSAKLRINSELAIDDTSVKAVSGISWSEETITWNNRPAMGSTLDTINTIAADTWYEFDLGSHITGDGTYTLGLDCAQNSVNGLWSAKERPGLAPKLKINMGPDTIPPSAPTGLSGSDGDSQVSLDWNDNIESDLDGYNVYRSTTSGSGYSKINPSLVSPSAYTDDTVSNNTTYYFKVSAVDKSSNESGYSNEASATPGVWTQLTYDDFESGWGNYTSGGANAMLYTDGTYAHQGTACADIEDDTDVAASFYHTNGIDVDTAGYTRIKVEFWFKTISFDNSAEDFWVQYYDGTDWHTVATYVYDTDFQNDIFYGKTSENAVYIGEGQYTFPADMKIRFMCDASGGGDDAYIDEIKVSATIDTTSPAAPAGLSGTGGVSEVSLDWNDNIESDLDGYNVYRSTTSGSGFSKLNASLVSSSAYTDSTVSNDTTYYYKVTAVDTSANESGYSSEDSAMPYGSLTFNPTDDATCKEYNPDDNFGSDLNLRVKGDPTGSEKESYLKFVVSGIGGDTVSSAALRIRSEGTEIDDTIVKAVSSVSWDEDTITWNNRPAMGSNLDSISPISTDTWYVFDLGSHITGDGTYTLGLDCEQNSVNGLWSSKERLSGAYSPEVTVHLE